MPARRLDVPGMGQAVLPCQQLLLHKLNLNTACCAGVSRCGGRR